MTLIFFFLQKSTYFENFDKNWDFQKFWQNSSFFGNVDNIDISKIFKNVWLKSIWQILISIKVSLISVLVI